MVTAQFGTKKFEVSSKKIYTPNGVSISKELDLEETAVSGKKPTVKVKGIKLDNISFELKLDSRFVDVYTEMTFWEGKLKAKKSESFKLGNYTLGTYYLNKIDIKNITIGKASAYMGATLTLSFIEDGKATNDAADKAAAEAAAAKAKAATVKASAANLKVNLITKGSVIKPKSGVRWYYTAEGALKKTGKSGKAYQKNMTVTYTYSKSGKVVCVNPQGLGWLKVEDVTVISNPTPKVKDTTIKAVSK